MQLYFDKEKKTDVPLAWFSDWDLSERNERDDDNHGGLPDGEAGDHIGTVTCDPIFLERTENQARIDG